MCNGLKSCCCCFSLRSGTLISGSFLMTVHALNVASIILRNFNLEIPGEICDDEKIRVSRQECFTVFKYGSTALMVVALLDCIYVITCILLFIGVFRRSEVLMLPFMSMTVLQVLRIGVITALSVYLYFLLKQPMVILINSSIIHLVVVIYLGVVVYSYYPKIMRSMFRDWYMELKKKRDDNLKTVVEPLGQIPVAWIDFGENGVNGVARSDSFMTLETAKDEERAKICKDILCIIIPILVVGAAWTGIEFFLYKYI
ncbi:lysosomal-associated transmembrane protein 4B-like [Palaemon carinicauda]|uniref:lysosomal-associated transmembrane protein 4B-like n=1 Tax=Palaemon carinicauda TaxID=392227 RepID=UPI0035B65F15